MEIESKYYTPEIEEFHVGFEYQVEDLHDNLVDKTWRYDKMNSGTDLMILEEWLKKDEIRVKHLDREDIGSEGWSNPTSDSKHFSKGNFTLTLMGKSGNIPVVEIRRKRGSLVEPCFIGIIKNKSELKRILKQIGVC